MSVYFIFTERRKRRVPESEQSSNPRVWEKTTKLRILKPYASVTYITRGMTLSHYVGNNNIMTLTAVVHTWQLPYT